MVPGLTYIVVPKKEFASAVKQSPVAEANFPLIWVAWETDGGAPPDEQEIRYTISLVKLTHLCDLADTFDFARQHSRPLEDWVLAHFGPPPYSEKTFDQWWEILDGECVNIPIRSHFPFLGRVSHYLYSDSDDSEVNQQLNEFLEQLRNKAKEAT